MGDFAKLTDSRDNAQKDPVTPEAMASLDKQLADRKWISPWPPSLPPRKLRN